MGFFDFALRTSVWLGWHKYEVLAWLVVLLILLHEYWFFPRAFIGLFVILLSISFFPRERLSAMRLERLRALLTFSYTLLSINVVLGIAELLRILPF